MSVSGLSKHDSKSDWRRFFKRTLRVFSQGSARVWAEEEIQKLLFKQLEKFDFGSGGIWASYQPLEGEPDLEGFLTRVRSLPFSIDPPPWKVEWAYPKMKGNELTWWSLLEEEGGEGVFEPGPFSVLEPISGRQVPVENIQVFLVPGLGFDRQGRRLGRGKGFYDRALEKGIGLKVGVAFSCQLVEELPEAPHDVRMDIVVTENEVIMAIAEGDIKWKLS